MCVCAHALECVSVCVLAHICKSKKITCISRFEECTMSNCVEDTRSRAALTKCLHLEAKKSKAESGRGLLLMKIFLLPPPRLGGRMARQCVYWRDRQGSITILSGMHRH